jgi:hypothetical protein
MSEQPQSINVTPFAIAPVQMKPVADTLLVVPDRSSKINYVIGRLVPGTPAIPAVPGKVGRGQILESGTPGTPNYQPYVPAVEGYPEVAAVPAVPDKIITIESGTVEMTDDEWNAWGKQDDATYRAGIVAGRLNLSIKS